MPAETSNALTLSDSQTQLQPLQEYNTDSQMMRAIHEVQGAIIVAQRFPRNEDQAYAALMKSCQRSSFAERVEYSYPRGKKLNEETGKWEDNIVSGASVYLSREMVRLWGNIQVGTEVVRDDEDTRHVRSVAWDVQTNTRRFAEVTFRKLIQRKKKEKDPKTGKMKDIWPPITEWVRPDERDLRELSNKQSAITERNCSLQLLPYDFIEDARMMARDTLAKGAQQDPEGTRKKLIVGFGSLNVSVENLEEYLGHAIGQCSPAQLVELRKLWMAIAEGQTTWSDVMEARKGYVADAVTEDQANEFFQAYKASGYSVQEASEYLAKTFKVKDSRKIPLDSFAAAMEWARTPAKKAEPKGEVIAPNKNAAPEKTVDVTQFASPDLFKSVQLNEEQEHKLEQLFDIDGATPKVRKQVRDAWAAKPEGLAGLIDHLESQLPTD